MQKALLRSLGRQGQGSLVGGQGFIEVPGAGGVVEVVVENFFGGGEPVEQLQAGFCSSALATCSVVSPHISRRVSATRASMESAG